MSCKTNQSLSIVAIIATAFTGGTHAYAQNSVERDAAVQPEEVTITARKRQESILKVPVIATAITQESLEKYATNDLYAVANRVPGILIGTAIGSIGDQLSIRGIGTTALNPTMDQSVSLNIDGLPLSQALAYGAGMFDLGQAEVFKGPQALFYGKNSPAGVISLRSADPTNELDVIARGGYEFEAQEKFGDMIISGPATPALKFRLAGHFSDSEGFFRNDAVAIPGLGGVSPSFRNYAPTRDWIVRGTVLFEPTDRYSARLKLNYTQQSVEGGGSGAQMGFCPDGTGGVAPTFIPFLAPDNCKVDESIRQVWMDPAAFPGIRNGGIPFSDIEQDFGTLEQNFKLTRALTLTSVSGFYELSQELLTPGSEGINQTMTFGVDNDFYNRQFTQELRLTSDYVNSPVNFMVGGFYQDGYMTNRLNLRGNEDLRLPEMLQSALHEIDIRSFSAFGQAMWDVTPQWEIAAGARWTDEKRDHVEFNFNPGSGPLGQVFGPDPQLKSANVSPEVSVTYKPTDDSTVFGSYKEGFKSGSFNSVQFVPSSAKDSFGDEKVRGGEMGIKARLFDRTVTLNLAGYFYHYTDLQVGTSERNADGTFAIRTLNAASANVHGVDFDMSYAPPQVEGLALRTAVNWNRARYGEFNNAPCGGGQTISEGCNRVFDPTPSLTYPAGHFVGQDLSGAHLVRAPEWTAVVGMDYEMPVGRAMRLTLGTGVNYTSKYLTTLIDNPDYYQHDYAKVSANIALRGANDAWEVALIGNNLNNEITTASCVNADSQNGTVFGGQLSGVATKGVAGSDELTCIAERGREIWVRFTFRPMELLRR